MKEKDRDRLRQRQGGRRQENYRDPENRTTREGARKFWGKSEGRKRQRNAGQRGKGAGTKRAVPGHLLT